MNNNEEEKRAIDIALKEAFLNDVDFIKLYNQERNDLRLKGLKWKDILKTLQKKYYYEYGLSKEEFRTLENVRNSYYKRLGRCKAHIECMIMSGKCYFLSMTFTNYMLDKTSEKVRRKYIQEYLNNFDYYVGNIDYGSEKEREHYHAIVMLKSYNVALIDLLKDIYQGAVINGQPSNYGFVDIKPIGYSKTDYEKVSKYINKLTNHAFKKTTVAKRLMYPKDKFIFMPVFVSDIYWIETKIEFVSYQLDPLGLPLTPEEDWIQSKEDIKVKEFIKKYVCREV